MASPDSAPRKAINVLAFSFQGLAVQKLWVYLRRISNPDKFASVFTYEDVQWVKSEMFTVLLSLTAILRVVLVALDDSELYQLHKPLPLHQVLILVRCLKVILFKIVRADPYKTGKSAEEKEKSGNGKKSPAKDEHAYESGETLDSIVQTHRIAAQTAASVLSNLYSRWARRPFSQASLWEMEETSTAAVKNEISGHTPFGVALLRVMPWAVSFHERMLLQRRVLDAEKLRIQGSNDTSSGNFRSQGIAVRVRKACILEDGMAAFSKIGNDIKDRVVIRYVNDFGQDEAGIDAGGLFKDFVTDLSDRIFDPSYGLFCTTSDNLLYPNPAASVLYDESELDDLYVFLGTVLGKAMFENITLQPQFAHFFLAFMHGKYNFMNLINDLATFDAELYKNLIFLKTYEGDVRDLGLSFAITDSSMGRNDSVELLPGGSDIEVDSRNKHRYVNLVAKYYLHDRVKRQAGAFFSGLYYIIQPDILSLFCPPELQIMISGSRAAVDINDLRQHTRYAGGYLGVDRHMGRFWSVVDSLSTEERALLLKFVTSCERPPSLGFSGLHPPFTIQRVDCSDDSRLPTASTCFNILKLPTYSSQSVLKQKLLLSITAKAGFDLS